MEQYARAIKNDSLRRMFENLFLPEVPVWFVLLILGLLAGRQLGLLTESCTDFVGSLEERYRKLGGEVTYNATVKEIIVENDRAVGVRLADGRELRADEVVSTGDGHSTIYHLLGGRYLDQKLTERYQNWKLISPIVTLSYGAACEFPNEPPLNFLLLKTPLMVGDVSLTGFPIRIFNYGGSFAPKGKTVVQALLHTDWNWWNELQKDRPRYDAPMKINGQQNYFSFKMPMASAVSFCTARSG